MTNENTPIPWEEGVALLPLERFDHPPLHRRPHNIVAAEADNQADLLLRKHCAGLRHGLRTSGARMRQAFISGDFGRNERVALRWTITGMREELFPAWHTLFALTIYELARGMRGLGPSAGGYACYLNQWAENPRHPLPSAAGWTLYLDDFDNLPDAAVKIRAGDPRRQDHPEFGISVLDVDGLRYSLPTADLQRVQATRTAAFSRRQVTHRGVESTPGAAITPASAPFSRSPAGTSAKPRP